MPSVLSAEEGSHVLGAQANLWGEYLLTPNSPAIATVYNVDLFKSCHLFANAALANVTTLRVDIARLPRQTLAIQIAPGAGEHDLCFIFAAPVTGPLNAIDAVKLLRLH